MYSRLSIGLMLLIWSGVAETRAANITIDDSQWSTPSLQLSKEGWNMLREGGAMEFINATAVAEVVPTLGNYWNSSVSWTDLPGSWVNMVFNGTDIYVYGTRGPQQGGYRVLIDNVIVGDYSAQQASEISFSELLFEAHDLSPEGSHALRVVAGAGRLSIDFAVITESTIETSQREPTSVPGGNLAAATGAATTPKAPTAFDSANLDWSKIDISLLPPNIPSALLSGYTPKQIAMLSIPYNFTWNPAAWFVVAFSSALGVFAICASLWWILADRQQRRTRIQALDGHSFLQDDESQGTTRSRRRLIAALRSKKISGPISQDDGEDSELGSAKVEPEIDRR